MDKNNENPVGWMQNLGLLSSDFGVTINFNNGCLLQRTAVPRPIATPTPSCDLIFADQARLNGDKFEIRVVNNNFASSYLTYSSLVWPTNWSPGVMYFNYFNFRNNRYYDPAEAIYTSPVATAAPSIELPGNTNSWWQSDFNNWPAVNQPGRFYGDLTFHFNSGLDCPVNRELWVTPTPTATATNTRAPASITPTYTATWLTNTPTRTATGIVTSTFTSTPVTPSTPTNTPVTPGIPSLTPTFTYTPTLTPTGATPTPSATPTVCLTPPDLGGCH
jgi:hypothetical protein